MKDHPARIYCNSAKSCRGTSSWNFERTGLDRLPRWTTYCVLHLEHIYLVMHITVHYLALLTPDIWTLTSLMTTEEYAPKRSPLGWQVDKGRTGATFHRNGQLVAVATNSIETMALLARLPMYGSYST